MVAYPSYGISNQQTDPEVGPNDQFGKLNDVRKFPLTLLLKPLIGKRPTKTYSG